MKSVTLFEAYDDPEWSLDDLIDILIAAREKIPAAKRAEAKASAGSYQGYGGFWVGYYQVAAS